jgi:hypothetical protein
MELRLEAFTRERLNAAGILAGIVALCQPAIAGDWDFQPRVTVTELFTDNVNLTQNDRESDFITIVRPGFSLERTGAARSHLSIDYSFDYSHYLRDKSRKDTHQYLDAEAGAEVFEDVFFVDGFASINQATISNTAGESATAITDTNNRTQVISTTINPNVRHHFRNWADYRFDYVLSNVRVADESIDSTVTQRYGSTLTSGRDFAFLNWSAETRAQTTDHRGADRTDERRLAQLTLRYVDRILFQPTASIGYEKIEDNTLLEQPDGLIWSVGGLFRPGPRTDVQVSYGQRYGDSNTSLDASYAIGPKTTVRVTYSQALETSQSLSLSELTSPTAGLSQSNTGFSLTNNAFRQSDFTAELEAERGRNDYRFELRHSERETDADGSMNTVQSARAVWQRDLTRELDGTLNLGYRTTDFGPTQNRVDDFITYGIDFNYRLQSDLRATIGYTGTRRISTQSGSSYNENAVSFSLTAQF